MTTVSTANTEKVHRQAAAGRTNRSKHHYLSSPEEEKLRQEIAEIELLLASISTILIGLGPDYRVNRWNAIAERVFGITAAEIIDKSLGDIDIQWDWDKVQQGLMSCRDDTKSVRVDDIVFARPDGIQGYLGFTISPIRVEAQIISGFIIIGADITERKALDNNLAQAEKLKSIGQLAAGIAHEINTPTQYVGDNTRFLQDAFQDIVQILTQYDRLLQAVKSGGVTADLIGEVEQEMNAADVDFLLEEIPAAIQQSLEGVNRIGKIVRAMKEFSHPGQEGKKTIDINKAIESTITVARNEWKYVADMVTDLDPSLPLVSCLPGELNQVILNLIVNATHALADVKERQSEQKGFIKVATCQKKNFVEIQISDSGSGIPEDIRHRIFDPFFTTKEPGKGTGQGLAIAHSVIVEKHGGSIHLETQEGTGTTFTICLPIKDQTD
ncbi:MAG: ATP-binding protein [Desulfobacterales bacterium]|jgi:PAS domain S-box-containing protein